ncbi:MAG: hypothetical protein V4524_00130 [Patescibacteria group bacterium]
MNKKLLIYLLVIIGLLSVALAVSLSHNFRKPVTTEIIPAFAMNKGGLAPLKIKLGLDLTATTSPDNFGCPADLIPVAVMSTDGSSKISCSSAHDSYPIGTGKEVYLLNGYYSTREVVMYPFDYDPSRDPLPATTTCSIFNITGGDSALIKLFKDMLASGNTVNKIDKNNLTLNIDLSDLENLTKTTIINSTPDQPATIGVKVKPVSGRDANYCESFIKIVSTQ